MIDGLKVRYRSHSYPRVMCDVFEAGRVRMFEVTSNVEGATAKGFIIHCACLNGFTINHRLEKPGSFGRAKGARSWSAESPGGLYSMPVNSEYTTQEDYHKAYIQKSQATGISIRIQTLRSGS